MHLHSGTCLPHYYLYIFYCFKMKIFRIKCMKRIFCLYNLEGFILSVCIDRGKAGRCCGLYCSCLASWGHAFLRVSRVWLQPPHILSLWPTSLLTAKLYIWVTQLEVFVQSFWAAVESRKVHTAYSSAIWNFEVGLLTTWVLPLYASFLLLHYTALIFCPLFIATSYFVEGSENKMLCTLKCLIIHKWPFFRMCTFTYIFTGNMFLLSLKLKFECRSRKFECRFLLLYL